MSKSPEELEREADQKRTDVERSISALKDKLSIGQIVDEVGEYLQAGQIKTGASNLALQMRDNPLALGLVGAGLAWLVLGEGVRQRAGHLMDERDDQFDHAGSTVRSYSPSFDDGVDVPSGDASRYGAQPSGSKSDDPEKDASFASSVTDRASEFAETAGDTVRHTYERGRRTAHDVSDTVRSSGRATRQAATRYGRSARSRLTDALENEPLIVGAFAVAIGAAIGVSLPSTRTEDKWLGAERDRLAEEAADYAASVKDKATTVAEKSYESAKQSASDEGLLRTDSGKTFAEKVETVVGAATDTAKNEIDKNL